MHRDSIRFCKETSYLNALSQIASQTSMLTSEIVVVKLLTPLKEMLEPLNRGSASKGYEA